MKKQLKTILALIIIAATVGAFAYYLSRHPEVLKQLGQMSPLAIVFLLAAYAVWFLALVLITRISLKMYQKNMGKQENFLFNAYSSLINFFGPGQSGPIFRAAYLKKRHSLGIKQFMFATLLYYGFYAVISATFVFIGTRPWWQTAAVMLMAGAGSFVVIRWYAKKKARLGREPGINPITIGALFGATALQMVAQVVIYAIELHNAGANASLGQVLSYTGVANFALFVALTPGAIGIREAFLVFSQGLHGLGNTIIVAANLVDRAVYLLFLGILFVLVLTMHAREKLHIKQLKLDKTDNYPAIPRSSN